MTTGDVRFLQQLDFPSYAVQLDWLLSDQNLVADGYDLQSAVIVALGTDAMAPISEPLPDPDATDRRGWWGDMDAEEIWDGWPVGCLLWLLSRTKITGPGSEAGSTIAKADGWTREAMRPFTAHGITSRIDVLADQTLGDRSQLDRIDLSVVLYRGPDPVVELRYAELWDELAEGQR
jgi:phage gp46-like protein